MKKKGIALVITGVLAVGTLTGFAYANSVKTFGNELSQSKVEQNIERKENKDIYKDMIKIMRKNGYKDLAKAMETNDYKTMDDFMKNMTDEDYKNMINIMKENGYGYMANMMESFSREEMIQMHNSMGGAENCHSSDTEGNRGMMGSF
jgi:hypothetical protein